jgi:hypothetical protein
LYQQLDTLTRVGVAVVLIVLVGLAVAAGLRPAGRQEIDEFAAATGIRTTPDSRRFIGYYLATGRRLRTLLVLAAVFLPGLVAEARGVGRDGFTIATQWVLGACLVGTLWAELALTRHSGTRRAASLVPRRLGTYLGRLLLWGPAVAGAASAVAWALVPLLPDAGPNGWHISTEVDAAVGVLTGLVVLALTPAAQVWILQRPPPVTSEDLLAADHAVRSASVRMLAAVATAMGLLNLSGALVSLTRPLSGPLDVLCGIGANASVVGALAVWLVRKPDATLSPRRLRPEAEGVGS